MFQHRRSFEQARIEISDDLEPTLLESKAFRPPRQERTATGFAHLPNGWVYLAVLCAFSWSLTTRGQAPGSPQIAQPAVQGAEVVPAGSAARGKELFSGRHHFQNGGPSCADCHTIAGLSFPTGRCDRPLRSRKSGQPSARQRVPTEPTDRGTTSAQTRSSAKAIEPMSAIPSRSSAIPAHFEVLFGGVGTPKRSFR